MYVPSFRHVGGSVDPTGSRRGSHVASAIFQVPQAFIQEQLGQLSPEERQQVQVAMQ